MTFSTVPPLASPADPAEWTRDPAAKHTFGTRRSSFLAVLADDSKPDKIPLSHPSSTTMPRSDHSAPSATPSAPSAPSAPAGPSAPPGPSGATADVAHSSAHPPGIPGQPKPKRTSACLHCRRQKLKVRREHTHIASLTPHSATEAQTSPAQGESFDAPSIGPPFYPAAPRWTWPSRFRRVDRFAGSCGLLCLAWPEAHALSFSPGSPGRAVGQ